MFSAVGPGAWGECMPARPHRHLQAAAQCCADLPISQSARNSEASIRHIQLLNHSSGIYNGSHKKRTHTKNHLQVYEGSMLQLMVFQRPYSLCPA